MTNPKDLVGIKKPPLHLVPRALIINTAMAFKDGAEKYGPYNWRSTTVNHSVYLAAIDRHLAALLDGEDCATDSGYHHCAHIAACCGIILDAKHLGVLNDDRPPPGPASDLIKLYTA